MKTKIIILISALVVSCSLFSCSSSTDEVEFVEMTDLDFREGIYRPNPFKFLDSVPPFSWMGMPDSVRKEASLQIQFNEDAVRSKSNAKIKFLDKNGNPINGLTINGQKCYYFDIQANNEIQDIKLSYIVDPAVGDSLLSGVVMAVGSELDQVNKVSLESNTLPIATWQLTHKTGVNWLRWLIFIGLILLAIALLCFIGYIIYVAFCPIAEAMSRFPFPTFEVKNKRESKNKKNKQKKPKLLRYLKKRQNILLNKKKSTANKAKALMEMRVFFDYNLNSNESLSKEQHSLLDNTIRIAMDSLCVASDMCPKSNGHWSRESKNSLWIPDDDYMPKNRQYSNLYGLTWGEIKQKYSIKGIEFRYYRISLKSVAKYSIKMSDFADFIDSDERKNLHEEAFKRLASKLGKTVNEVKELKEGHPVGSSWEDYDRMTHINYVWHEDIDCKTLYLVPQEIHGNVNHFGGVGMCQILKENGLI